MTRAARPLRAAVLGADVSQSLSPAIHRAAFAALGRDGRYEAISVEPRQFRASVRRLAREGYRYVNVTIPHKRAAALMADAASAAVRASGAANTLLLGQRRDGTVTVRAHNTDGEGLLLALNDGGLALKSGSHIVVVGAGGAAAGGVLRLLRTGAQVTLLARRPGTARALGRRLPTALAKRLRTGGLTPDELTEALAAADGLVSAVPADAWQATELRAPLRALKAGASVLEMAYRRTGATPLARAVARRDVRYQDGLRMLVHQAAYAVELAVGSAPPVHRLLAAVGLAPATGRTTESARRAAPRSAL